ncbi:MULTISPECIES: beta strand repeat-containing protein [unclassified Methanobrevibacter]|jgi:hypothetical protein|uniref:beta strand repeat-containing protein n=3 Tax=Methanobrevibacter TaxID=2172 RepID=UPI0039B8A24D
MKVTKVTLILGILIIFLTIGVASATDINYSSNNIGDSNSSDINLGTSDISTNTMVSTSNNINTLSASNSYNITDDSYSNYFNESGNIKSSSGISSGDTINIGNVNGKNFIINTPLTITNLNSTSVLANGSITLLSGSDGSTISGLTLISNTTNGINVYSSNNTITNNNIKITGNNSYGIYAEDGNNNIISNNIISMNGINSYTFAIDIQAASYFNDPTGTATITGYKITNNTINGIVDSKYYAGLYASGLINSIISNNNINISSNSFVYGIAISNNWGLTNSTGNITISKNQISAKGQMVYLIETFKNTEMNIIGKELSAIGNGVYAIAAYSITNSNINNNLINIIGGNISLLNITNNDVIKSGNSAITLVGDSTGNNINTNTIKAVDTFAINLESSSNKIDNNNIVLNTTKNYTNYMLAAINIVSNNPIKNVTLTNNNINYDSAVKYVYGVYLSVNYPYTGEFTSFTINNNNITGKGYENMIYGVYAVGLDNSNILNNNFKLENNGITYGISGNNVYSSTVIPSNVTISKNTINSKGIMNYLIGSLFMINNYTISDNVLIGEGKGVYAISGYSLTNSTINNNNITIIGGNISKIALNNSDAIKSGNAAIKLISGSTGNSISDNLINSTNANGMDIESSSNSINDNVIFINSDDGIDVGSYGSSSIAGIYASEDGLTDLNINNNDILLTGNADYNYGMNIIAPYPATKNITSIKITNNSILANVNSNYMAGIYTNAVNSEISNNFIDINSNNFVYGIATDPFYPSTGGNNIITYNNVTGEGVDVRLIEVTSSSNDTINYNNLKAKGNAVYGVAGYALDNSVINHNNMTFIGGNGSSTQSGGDMIPSGNAAVILIGNSKNSYITNNTFNTNQKIYINQTGATNLTVYNNTNKSASLKTFLICNNMVEVYGAGQNFTGKLLDEFGDPIVGQHIALNLTRLNDGASKIYGVTTDLTGEFQLEINLFVGNYTASASYNGFSKDNLTYLPSTSSVASIQVVTKIDNRTSTILSNKNFTEVYGAGQNFTGTLSDINGSPIVGQHVALNLTRLSDGASKIYWVTTDNAGEYQLEINLFAGKYTCLSSYDGNGLYQPSTSSLTSITVTKA